MREEGAHRLHSQLSMLGSQVACPLNASAVEYQLCGSFYIACKHPGQDQTSAQAGKH